MNVHDFCYLAMEGTQELVIWSIEEEKEVYNGDCDEAMHCIYDCEYVQSFGIENGIIYINIE